MLSKFKFLACSNIIFYLLLLFHRFVLKSYGDDYIVHAALYIALSLSTIIMEESFRKKLSVLKKISTIDVLARVVSLILNILYLYFDFHLAIINLSIAILFILNIFIEIFISKIYKVSTKKNSTTVSNVEINRFITKLLNNKDNIIQLDIDANNSLNSMAYALILSGKINIVCILIYIGLFISSFIYKHFNNLMILLIIFSVILLFVFTTLNVKLTSLVLNYDENKLLKIVFENLSFISGYIILFLAEVFLHERLGGLRVSVWFLSIICFIPFLNRKYTLKENLKNLYREYNSILQ